MNEARLRRRTTLVPALSPCIPRTLIRDDYPQARGRRMRECVRRGRLAEPDLARSEQPLAQPWDAGSGVRQPHPPMGTAQLVTDKKGNIMTTALSPVRSTLPTHPGSTFLEGKSHPEAGMTTTEYAVGTLGACAIAGILYWLSQQDWMRELIAGIFRRGLNIA